MVVDYRRHLQPERHDLITRQFYEENVRTSDASRPRLADRLCGVRPMCNDLLAFENYPFTCVSRHNVGVRGPPVQFMLPYGDSLRGATGKRKQPTERARTGRAIVPQHSRLELLSRGVAILRRSLVGE